MAIMSRMYVLACVAVNAVLLPSVEEDAGDSLGLPEVDDMLSAADESVSELTKKADLIQEATAKAQNARKVALEETRNKYEIKLAEAATSNTRVEAAINTLQDQISAQKLANTARRDGLKAEQRLSATLHEVLGKIGKQLSSAVVFLDEAVNNSNVSNTTAFLKALAAPKIDAVSFVAKMTSDKSTDGDDEVVMMQLGSGSRSYALPHFGEQAMPEKILESMSSGLANLTAAQDEGETRMQARFLATQELLTEKAAKLSAQRDELTKELQALRVEQHELIQATGKVDCTKADMAARLDGLKHFYETNIKFIVTQLGRADALLERNATA